jgi:tRNA A-37 threonylcarbamoyl transferase component Bud32
MGSDALLIPRLPGQSLLSFLQAGTLTNPMITAAAHELRRAHELSWTHGDPHLTNILYDGTRAYLIDFETRHVGSIPFQERCADDLLVILLDLMGRGASEGWQELSRALISGYDDKGVRSALAERLYIPTGFELVLWKSRTHYLPQTRLAERIAQLKDIVTSV